MDKSKRGSFAAGIGLILIGAMFLVFYFIPGLSLHMTWPIIFLVLGFAFFLPGMAWPESRRGLAALYIPGTILLGLGVIFFSNTLSGNWYMWAYEWLLIPASVGLGMMLAAWGGNWNRVIWQVGLWIALISVAAFSVFAALFGDKVIKLVGAGILVLLGIGMLARSFMNKKAE
jgi:hypothetical protein